MLRLTTFFVLSVFVLGSCKTRHDIFRKTNDFFHVVFQVKSNVAIPEKEWDPDLGIYVGRFVEDANIRGVQITPDSMDMLKRFVYVDELSSGAEPGVMAACTRYYAYKMIKGQETKVKWMNIEVLRNQAELFSRGREIFLRKLLYHEMFHCFLNKGHLPDGVPGIMAPTLDSNSSDVERWSALLDEMFSPEYLQLIPDT